jgi:hypothetical protein
VLTPKIPRYVQKQNEAEAKRKDAENNADRKKIIAALEGILEHEKAAENKQQTYDYFKWAVTWFLQQKQYRITVAYTVVTALGVTAAFIAGIFAFQQLGVMRVQFKAMKSQLEEMQKQSVAAISTAVTGAETLNASNESFQIQQRPYLVTQAPSFVDGAGPTVIGRARVNLFYFDIGKTPAIKIHRSSRLIKFYAITGRESAAHAKVAKFMQATFDDLHRELEKEAKSDSQYASVLRNDLAPGANGFFTDNLEDALSQPDIDAVKSEQLALFDVGVLTYTDAFNGKYETEFCYYFIDADPNIWHFCDSHHTIN